VSEPGLFGERGTVAAADARLIEAYRSAGVTLDALPYTEAFEGLYGAVRGSVSGDKAAVFHRLHNLRKAGKLPTLGRAATSAPRLDAEHEAELVGLVEREVGRLSLRDRLVYAEAFDRVVESFNASTGLAMSHHDVWRVVAKLAK